MKTSASRQAMTTTPRRLLITCCFGLACTAAARATSSPAPVSLTEPAKAFTVRHKDKLEVIGKTLLRSPGDWAEVAQLNRLPNPNRIYPNQTILIPLRLLKSELKPATLTSVSGDVRVNGQAAKVGDPLGEGAQIQLGANSTALARLPDGSDAKFLPSTLAEVAQSRLYATRDPAGSIANNAFSGTIRLIRGAVETLAAKVQGRAKPLEVITPTALVGVRGTQFRVAFGDDESNPTNRNSRTEVLDGSVRADNSLQGSNANVAAGSGGVINPAQREVLVEKLLEPPSLLGVPAQVERRPNSAAVLPLPPLPGAVAYRLQLARDDKFEQLADDRRLPATGNLTLNATDGAYFLRLRGIAASGLEGLDATKAIVLATVVPIIRVTLSGGALETATAVGPGAALSWQAAPQRPDAALAELSTSEDFATTLQTIRLTESRWTGLELKPGERYFLRLRWLDAAGQPTAQSDVYRFDVPLGFGSTVTTVMNPLRSVQPAPSFAPPTPMRPSSSRS